MYISYVRLREERLVKKILHWYVFTVICSSSDFGSNILINTTALELNREVILFVCFRFV